MDDPTTRPASAPEGGASLFHEGECAVQSRIGVRDKVAVMGPRAIRDFMPDQHRGFFAQLPFLIVGSVDAAGQPWASLLAHPPGAIDSPDPRTLRIRAHPLEADPLGDTLRPGIRLGVLGIEPHTRRRNRMNGVVEAVSDQGFSVRVQHSYGNCPKYIRPREAVHDAAAAAPTVWRHAGVRLDEASRRLIERVDTFFIATAHPAAGDATAQESHGVDVSHRGGDPGFVRVDADDALTVPDFVGNFLFNTLGNLELHPRAGLLFLDVDSGDRLYLAVHAQVVWDVPEVGAFPGAQRLLRLGITQVQHLRGGVPLRWRPAG